MPKTITQTLAYAYAHPTRLFGLSWSGWCESFVYRAGGFTRSFGSALLAGNASGWLNPDWASAPVGALHYWSGVYIKGVESGHVAFSLGGGDLLMASNQAIPLTPKHKALGSIHFSNYRLGGYRGWSLRHGPETLAIPAAAAATSRPTLITALLTPEEEPEMKPVILTNSKNAGIIINWAEGTWRGLYGSETKAHLANGYKITKAATDAEFDAIKAQLRPWIK